MDVVAARTLAVSLLGESGDRWRHVVAAARRAEELAPVVGPIDRELFVSAVWLHDVGRAPALRRTGHHPLDAALHLRALGWPERLCALVAHHCASRELAGVLGVEAELASFEREEGTVTDAIVHADMSAGPCGERMSLRERLDGIDRRHAADVDAVRAAIASRRTALMAACLRTDQRLGALRPRRFSAVR